MKIWPIQQQQSEIWFEARRGKVTASRFDEIVTPTGKDSGQWESLACDLCAEIVRASEADEMRFIGNRHTDRGNELEPVAREVLAKAIGREVEQVGFITRDDEVVGCSPDGLIRGPRCGFVAGAELKCPTPGVHARYVVNGGVPPEYLAQVHGSMAVTGLRWWYFVSYCRGFKPLIVRAERDAYTDKVAAALDRFVVYYAAMQQRLLPLLRGGKEAA